MPLTSSQQKEEIDASASYNDALTISNAESSATNIEDDLNYIRTQQKNFLGSTNWFDAIPAGGDLTSLAARTKLVDKKAIFNTQVLTDVVVGVSANFAVLSVSGSETPTVVAAIGAVTTEGAITALLAGASGAHSLLEVAGLNTITPKNLVKIQDGTTGDPILSGGKEVQALLQIESVAVDGDVFDDTTKQGQLSFVRVNATNDDLEACPAADIQGKTINYIYNFRTNLDSVNEQNFSHNSNFVDQVASVDVTLDNAVDNQLGPVTQVQNIDHRITDTFEYQYSDSVGAGILTMKALASGDLVEVGDGLNAVAFIGWSTGEFKGGITADSAGTAIAMGTVAGEIGATGLKLNATAGDLNLEGATEINFIDSRQTTAMPLTDALNASLTGSPISIYAAINNAASSGGFTSRADVNTTGVIAADTDVAGPGAVATQNLSGDLVDYTSKTFITDVLIFINGKYMRPGVDALANNDVYPSLVAGDITAGVFRAEKVVKNNANIMMLVK